ARALGHRQREPAGPGEGVVPLVRHRQMGDGVVHVRFVVRLPLHAHGPVIWNSCRPEKNDVCSGGAFGGWYVALKASSRGKSSRSTQPEYMVATSSIGCSSSSMRHSALSYSGTLFAIAHISSEAW